MSLKDYVVLAKAIHDAEYKVSCAVELSEHGQERKNKRTKCDVCKLQKPKAKEMAEFLYFCFTKCIRGQCLDCIRDGKEHSGASNCRLAHRSDYRKMATAWNKDLADEFAKADYEMDSFLPFPDDYEDEPW